MTKLFSLKGKIQNYAWAGTQFIPNLTGIKPNDKKYAEYWLGAHVNAPSILRAKEGKESLNIFLNLDLTNKLGHEIAEKFIRLPFLFKVLDVNDMLSIQVHPARLKQKKGLKKKMN